MAQLKLPVKDAVDTVRFRSEKELLDEIMADDDLRKRAESIKLEEAREANRRRLLASGLRITDRIIPSLVQSVKTAQRIAQMADRETEIYVYESPVQNAACMDFGEGRLFLLFSSSLVERLSPLELMFVIGHELGHSYYGHHKLPVNAILDKSKGMEAERAMKLMSWNRRCEISADRVGMLCCQDLSSATYALIKLSCGLREPLLKFNVEDYLAQMKEIQTLSESVEDTEDWFSSHPFNPLRVVALHHLWESRLLADMLGHAEPRISTEEMDKRIGSLLDSMEPASAERKESGAKECLLWGGYMVAAADGRIDKAECASIRTITSAEAAKLAEEEIRGSENPPDTIRRNFDQAARRCLKLPPADRHALMQKLIVVAKADDKLEDAEKATLREVCGSLQISPTFVDQILMMTE